MSNWTFEYSDALKWFIIHLSIYAVSSTDYIASDYRITTE